MRPRLRNLLSKCSTAVKKAVSESIGVKKAVSESIGVKKAGSESIGVKRVVSESIGVKRVVSASTGVRRVASADDSSGWDFLQLTPESDFGGFLNSTTLRIGNKK
jgi:hypothetical protein